MTDEESNEESVREMPLESYELTPWDIRRSEELTSPHFIEPLEGETREEDRESRPL